jgi:hypothetical protein
MLYECLTGERLFQGETDFSTLEKVRNVDIAAPRQVNPAIPEPVEKIILKALAKDVEDRYQWCSEMLADLQAYLMSQDVVFTAKSLSGWLKDVFSPEIDRERQLLEQYKRVGRDGLIAGVPSAQAKLDVNEHLGEAGPPEGDATMLGGPNFDDVEKDTGAAPDVPVHQLPAVGGPRGSVQRKGASAPTPVGRHDDEEAGEGDFGEEAPTEIFGETESAPEPAPPPVVSRSPSRDLPRASTVPPRPPPGARPSSQRPIADTPQPLAAAPRSASMGMQDGLAAVGYNPGAYPQPMGTPPGPQPAMSGPQSAQMAMGTPGLEGQPNPRSTVIGVQAPVGIPNYSGYRAAQQAPQQHQSGSHPMPNQGYPTGYPQGSYPGYPPGYPQQYAGYPSGQMPAMGAPPVEQAPIAEGKRSTLMRDIAIGVGIAAFVLIGFLVVKLVILDDGKPSSAPAPTSKFATVKLAMPSGIAAEMFIDGQRVATVTSESPGIPVTAGVKHIKLVGTNGLSCDDSSVKLEAGKTTTLECNFGMTGSGSAASPGAATGRDSAPPQGSADSGSGEAKTIDKPVDVKATEVKTDVKATEVKTDVKATEVKPTDVKKTDAKATDPKLTDVKPADTKATDVKKPVDTKKLGETKPADTKLGTPVDKKSTEVKPADTQKAAAGDPNKGYLQVFSKPPAKILVDGQDTNLKTPISGQSLALAPGKHKITFVIGDDRFTYPVTIKAGVTETMSKDLQ